MENKREKVKKPTGVKAMIILNAISIAIYSIPFIIVLPVMVLPDTNPFKEGFMSALGGSIEHVAQLLGLAVFQITIPILTVICILKKKFILLNICLIVGILASSQSPFHFIPAVASLIMLYANKDAKQYIKNTPAAEQ